MDAPVKVRMHYLQCDHFNEFESPGVMDPAGEFCKKPRDGDGVVQAASPGTCPLCYIEPIGNRLFALETLAVGFVAYAVSIEKQLEMTATEALYFERQVQERMRNRRSG